MITKIDKAYIEKVKKNRLRAYVRAIKKQNEVTAKHNRYRRANDGFIYFGAVDEEAKVLDRVCISETNCFKAGFSSQGLYIESQKEQGLW